jgi:PTH2 family peptidyl-tRNA hydrolase
MKIKQVLVVRHDLKMRMGKAVAQGAHAAMMFLVHRMASCLPLSDEEVAWFEESAMTKICVRVESEAELLEIEAKARDAGLTVNVITDAGFTEFHGVPTKTCLAIGPNDAEKVDAITGGLTLL